MRQQNCSQASLNIAPAQGGELLTSLPLHDRVGLLVQQVVSQQRRQTDTRRVISHVLTELTKSTPAQVSAFAVLKVEPPASPNTRPQLTFLDVIEGGQWPADARQSYMTYLADEAAGDPFLESLFAHVAANPGRVTSIVRRDMVSDDTWYGSRHYQKYRGAVGFDDCLYTAVFTGHDEPSELPPGLFVGIGLHALKDSPRFTPADSDLARIAVFASMPLIAASLDSARAGAANLFATLTPRQREVLLLLNEGLSTKQIAERLALAPNSVQTYIQALCKRLNVRGQLEAIALCNRKGWLVRE